jgi:hypothetical protein
MSLMVEDPVVWNLKTKLKLDKKWPSYGRLFRGFACYCYCLRCSRL